MSAEARVKKIRIQQYRSKIGFNHHQRDVLRGLGFKRLNQIVERENTPEVMGMVKKIPHLVRVIEEE